MNETENPVQDIKQYYVLGFIVLVAIIVAGYMMRGKLSSSVVTSPTPSESPTIAPTPTPGQITKLGCDMQYYNPKIAYTQYYLSVEGGDVSPATKVDCTFTASQSGKIVTTEKVTSPLTPAPQRSGSTFRCTTKATELTPNAQTVVAVSLKDDTGATASCSAPFVFPAP